MICRHVEMFHAVCPVDQSVTDYYEVTFESAELVKVEALRDVLTLKRGKVAFQESLTQALSNLTNCRVTTTGMHGTTRSTVTCEPT